MGDLVVGGEQIDPIFEVDAPKFYDFTQEIAGNDDDGNTSEGDSWFDRKAKENTELTVENKFLHEEEVNKDKTILINSEETELVAAVDSISTAKGSDDLVSCFTSSTCSASPNHHIERDEISTATASTFAPQEELESIHTTEASNETSGCVTVTHSSRDLSHRRSRDPTKKLTACSMKLRSRIQPSVETFKHQLKEKKRQAQTTNQKLAALPVKPPLVPNKTVKKGSTMVGNKTEVKPFSFATDRRIERRSASLPRHPTEDKSVHDGSVVNFVAGLRQYAPSPATAAGCRHATEAKPFHFHTRKRSSSVEGSRDEGSCSPKKKTCSGETTGTSGVFKPNKERRSAATKPLAPSFATDRRLAIRREHSIERERHRQTKEGKEEEKLKGRMVFREPNK